MENPVIKLEDKTVAEFNFNFEELKNWANSVTEKYQNLVITEDQVVSIKKEMADINKYSKEIDSKRKEFEKKYKARIDPVLAQILEIKGIFDSAYNGLKTQVDSFETAEREKRRLAIQEQIDEVIRTEGLQDYANRFEIKDKWLNKTTSQKSIKEDIYSIVNDINALLQAQEEARKQKEERIDLVSQFYKAKVESFGFDLGKESYFISMCDRSEGTAITTMINNAFEAEKKYRNNLAKEAEAKRVAEVSKTIDHVVEPTEKVELVSNPDELEVPEKVYSVNIQFTVKSSKLPEVKELIAKLKPLCETWKNI